MQVVLVRDTSATGYDLALLTTHTEAGPAAVIERYAAARNRVARAVERTVPFQLACQAIAMVWHATAGHSTADIDAHRARAPWYASQAHPSTADMLAKLRCVLIAAKFRASHPDRPTPEEINVIRLAWEAAAA